MNLVSIYRSLLERISSASQARDGTELELEVTDSEYLILLILQRDWTIFITREYLHRNDIPDTDSNGNVSVIPGSPNHFVTIEINTDSEVVSINERLAQLESWEGVHPELLGNTEDGRTMTPIYCHGFSYFQTGLIVYNGNILFELSRQESFLLGTLINNCENLVYAHAIKEEHYKGNSSDPDTVIAQKIISPLNKKLRDYTKNSVTIRTMTPQEGYMLTSIS